MTRDAEIIEDGKLVEIDMTDSDTLKVLQSAEIDQQIATAHRFPRTVSGFLDEATALVQLDEETAEECIYTLPRDGKAITGPSARFAEIIAHSWGNCRAGARIVEEQRDFIVAQGMFFDLQKNVAITFEVKRRIVNKYGKRFNADMIGVTSSAACSIALRNSVLKGVPKALWKSIYNAACRTITGDEKTVAKRRAIAMQGFEKLGVSEADICTFLDVGKVADITPDHLVDLRGAYNAIKSGEVKPETFFKAQLVDEKETASLAELNKAKPSTAKTKTADKPADAKPEPDPQESNRNKAPEDASADRPAQPEDQPSSSAEATQSKSARRAADDEPSLPLDDAPAELDLSVPKTKAQAKRFSEAFLSLVTSEQDQSISDLYVEHSMAVDAAAKLNPDAWKPVQAAIEERASTQ